MPVAFMYVYMLLVNPINACIAGYRASWPLLMRPGLGHDIASYSWSGIGSRASLYVYSFLSTHTQDPAYRKIHLWLDAVDLIRNSATAMLHGRDDHSSLVPYKARSCDHHQLWRFDINRYISR